MELREACRRGQRWDGGTVRGGTPSQGRLTAMTADTLQTQARGPLQLPTLDLREGGLSHTAWGQAARAR